MNKATIYFIYFYIFLYHMFN